MAEYVNYSAKLITFLADSLGCAFHQQNLNLTTKPQKPGAHFHIRLENALRIAQGDDGYEQHVAEILMPDQRSSTFWFGFVAAFEFSAAHRYSLRHASLSVFQDIAGELVPLFRAEWDRLAASDENSPHAQPHWHFVQSPQRIGSIARILMRPSGQTSEFSAEEPTNLFSGLVDCGRFHFAMTSMWEKNETPPYKKRLFDSSDFPKWFRSLTDYIAGQIAYVVAHMPPVANAEANPFLPTAEEFED